MTFPNLRFLACLGALLAASVTLRAQIYTNAVGNVGIGVPASVFRLDVANRMRVRGDAGTATAGLWFHETPTGRDRAFVGMYGSDYVGFFGAGGVGWGMTMNVNNGNVGIGNWKAQHKLTIGSPPVPDSQVVGLRVVDTNPQALWKGAAFGGAAASVILGEVGGKAMIGGHAGKLEAWSDLILQRDGGRLGIGTANPLGKLHVVDGHVNIRTTEGSDVKGWAKDGLTVEANPGVGYSSFRVLSMHDVVSDRALVSVDRHTNNYLLVRMDGKVGIGTPTPEAKLDVAGNVRCTTLELTSDRRAKSGFRAIDGQEVLEKLAEVPISTWHYSADPSVRHIGPMAQDFQAAFGTGSDDKHISVVDGLGVSLAAIQGLHRELKTARAALRDQDAEIVRLRQDLLELKRGWAALRRWDAGEASPATVPGGNR